MEKINTIFKWIKEHVTLILLGVIVLLGLLSIFSIRSCSNKSKDNDNLQKSIEAIFDSIHYYKGKNGELIANKKIMQGDIDLLKIANKELYDRIESMKQKDADHIIYVENVIENPPDSTKWVYTEEEKQDSVRVKDFDFTNKYRSLQGYITSTPDYLSMNVTKDEIYFDYLLTTKGNEVYITSSNPYVKFNEITGLVIPEQIKPKKKHWHIGPVVSGGYDVVNLRFGAFVGVGIMYDVISF